MTPPEPASDPALFGSDTAAGLESLRARLLDLTRNNRLLNFKPTAKSLRLVNFSPDWIHERLVTKKKQLRLVPVPRPQPGMLTPEQEKTYTNLEKSDKAAQARFVAETLHGVPGGFELPGTVDQDTNPVHLVNNLHFLEHLEAKAQAIKNAARLAMEETGSNVLYLALGFLEWFESESSSQPNLAPLFLIPVALFRTQNVGTRAYEFHLEFTEEELMPNLSLMEKLQADFGLMLPSLDQAQSPEAYSLACAQAFNSQPRWRIQRAATVALLEFRKMVMHKDLDPANWPDPTLLLKHPRVSEFFEGEKSSEGRHADDLSIDLLKIEERELPLIENADSSQHNAILDALNGRDLVIQGPPGTGKSQTITNLIGAALGAGKTVLFMAEKSAALQVVKDRLTKAGLGDFCLELHSDNANKPRFYADLRRRLNGKYPEPRDVDKGRTRLRAQWDELRGLVLKLQEEDPSSGLTLQNILARATKSRRQLEAVRLRDAQPLTTLFDLERDAVDPTSLDDLADRLERFQNLVAELCPRGGTIDQHPWHGLRATPAHAMPGKIIGGLQSAREALHELLQQAENVQAGHRCSFELTPDNFERCRRLRELLGTKRHRWSFGWLRLHFSAGPKEASAVLACLQEIVRLKHLLTTTWRISARFDLAALSELLDLGRLAPLQSDRTLGQLQRCVHELLALETVLPSLTETIAELEQTFSLTLTATPADLQLASALTKLLGNSAQVPGITPTTLLSPEFSSTLAKGTLEAERINAQSRLLAEEFDLSELPCVESLRYDAGCLAEHPWFPFLRKTCRAARQRLLGFRKDQRRKFGYKTAAEALDRLVNWKTAVEQFNHEPAYGAAFGPAFTGISTDWTRLTRARDWARLVDEHFPASGSSMESRYRDVLFTLQPSRLETLQHFVAGTRVELFQRFCHALEEATEQLVFDAGRDSILCGFQSAVAVAKMIKGKLDAVSGLLTDKLLPLSEVAAGVVDLHRLHAALKLSSERCLTLGSFYRGVETDVTELARQAELWQNVTATAPDPALLGWVEAPEPEPALNQLLSDLEALQRSRETYNDAFAHFVVIAKLEPETWWRAEEQLPRIHDRISRALASPEKLDHWLQLNGLCETLDASGLRPVIQAILNRHAPLELGPTILQYLTWEPLARSLTRREPLLQGELGKWDTAQAQFRARDREFQELTRQTIAARLGSRPIPPGIHSPKIGEKTELALLQHQVGRQVPRGSLRDILSRASGAMLALKPCVMMGPLAVAQYLERGKFRFDLLVLDEASQMRPEDALGAMARCGQCVIVGDNKQLPPTSFFDVSVDGGDPDEEPDLAVIQDSESILDAASSLYQPARMLRWHYRSKHPSLIAFSNAEFYGNELILFPSVHEKSPEYGVKLIEVPGVYGGSKNEIEAETVVAAVLDQLRQCPRESLGVAAMNSVQANLIEELLEKSLREDPVAQANAERWDVEKGERVFVKNLENVQGDERDVIFISITYGRDEQGVFRKNFGPINGQNGGRRLNVLFSRARKRVQVYASFTDADLALTPESSAGAQSLKRYLEFARTGKLSVISLPFRPSDSIFEDQVRAAVEAQGFVCQPQLGTAGYFIDLAVRDPEKPGSFILAIECDGASYHSSKSARDRDRLRQAVLEGMGWRLHRVWSTDWFRNPQGEVTRICEAIEAALKDRASEIAAGC